MSLANFFERPALEVAPELLGAVISHDTEQGRVSIRITEVEAYHGGGVDPGSHAHRGPTPRTAAMFGAPGHLYVYLSYGLHMCMNLVCSPDGIASGVLVRAGQVVEGLELARSRHPKPKRDHELAKGPGVFTRALAVDLRDYGSAVDEWPFVFELPAEAVEVTSGPRTGVGGVAGGGEFPWRFWVPGDRSVSRYQRHKTATD